MVGARDWKRQGTSAPWTIIRPSPPISAESRIREMLKKAMSAARSTIKPSRCPLDRYHRRSSQRALRHDSLIVEAGAAEGMDRQATGELGRRWWWRLGRPPMLRAAWRERLSPLSSTR